MFAVLKIGDIVTFKNLKFDGFLSAEGVLREDIGVSGPDDLFDSTLFSVHLKRQYSAAKEYNDFIKQDKGSDPSTHKYLSALQVI